ncbi:unnamed protein product [Dibothriocephalus latus]|uniref:Uncharacterized protein n=1 Tax=Dibothriocephalus latus TaxID=60516 RepID=A0A3P7NND4_DIBLA|nr:unnamed protein product [Dibothriocephalus latus]
MTAEETRLVPPASSTPSDRQPLPIGSSTPTAGAAVSVAPFLPRLEFTFSS